MKLTLEMLERGELLKWSAAQVERISKLDCVQPCRWTAVGCSSIRRGLAKQLRAVGLPVNWYTRTIEDIMDMARLKAASK